MPPQIQEEHPLAATTQPPRNGTAPWRKMNRGALTPPAQSKLELKEHMSNDKALPLDAETVNAIVTALGAVVFATVRQMPADKQTGFANDLARLAKNEERQGRTASETILMDMHRAAVAAAS